MSYRISVRPIGNFLAIMLFFVFGFCSPGSTLAQSQLGGDIDGKAASDWSGGTVSLSADGSRLAISAQVQDFNGTNPGQVRVYTWSGTSWQQLGEVIDGEAVWDWFGISLSLSADGNRLAIGASDNDGSGPGSGHVRVYTWSGTAWLQLGDDIDGEAPGDSSGYSVSLSTDGTRLAIGATGNDGNGDRSGHVRVYAWSGTAWLQLGDDIDGEAAGDASGFSVSLRGDGNRLAIGAPTNDGTGSDSGHVRVYTWSGTAWLRLGGDIDGEAAGDWSGSSRAVSLSADGSRLTIGAQRNDGNGSAAGHVRVYEWSGTTWLQLGDDIDGEMAGDGFGRSVSLSADGNRLAISAPYKDGSGSESGQVQVYIWSGTNWIQLGDDIDGEAAFDEFGVSVSLSGGGDRLAIGAPFNDGNANNSGHVRVYQLPSEGTVDLGGEVQTTDGTGVCAMVLASGQYMFSCSQYGPYTLNNLSREIDGTVKRQVYAHGFFPSVDVLPGTTYETVVMEQAKDCPDYNLPYNPDTFPGSAGKRHSISGRVLLQSTDKPICAMVLANGAYMFSCDGSGRYSLEFPLDSKGQFKLQVYADGFAPSVQSFDEFSLGSDVRMARSTECQ
jgi:hypothetical protein